MPTNISQLRSLMGAASYGRKFLPKLAAGMKALNALLKKGVRFEFTAEHTQIAQTLLGKLPSPQVLAFPDFPAAISGDRPFQLITDASTDGLGAVVEQEQSDATTRPLCFLSWATLPNDKNWSATKLECAAIVWAVKKNRQLFYGIPFIVVSDHQSLKNLESLAAKVDRVQRWYDVLSAYTYKLVYRPGRLNGNADLMSRLPLPVTDDAQSAALRLTDPTDIDVYFVGASGLHPRLTRRTGTGFGGLEPHADENFEEGEREDRPAPRTTDEQAKLSWEQMQNDRKRKHNQTRQPVGPRVYAIRDDSPPTNPDTSQVVSGQLEPGQIVHASPMTKEEREFLGSRSKQKVAVTN